MGKHKEIDDINLSITLLDKKYKRFLKDFKTGNRYPEQGLGDYIMDSDAFEDMQNGDGVSYLVFRTNEDDEPEELVSYFTLVSSAMPYMYRIEENDEVYEEMCGIPAIRIHMFAVSDKYQDVFFKGKPIAAWIFETIIHIIDEKSQKDTGIKAIYLHALPSSKGFYKKNKFLEAEPYMKPFAGMDDDLDVMYVFIRKVSVTYQNSRIKRMPWYTRLRKKIGKWLIR